MGLNISGLNELRERLERLRPEEVMAQALAEQTERMAARVRDGLSEQPGAAGHDEPWLQSGALRDSVGAQADGLQAVVGSSDPAAVPQEMGTARMPARPFLVPAAADIGEDVARAVGARMAAALRGDSTNANGIDADLSGGGVDPNSTADAGGSSWQQARDLLTDPHTALGAASFVPGVLGSAASAADGALYAAQGKWADAGIALGAAAVGIVSDAGAARLAGKSLKAGAEALGAAGHTASAGKLAHAASDADKAAQRAAEATTAVHGTEEATSVERAAGVERNSPSSAANRAEFDRYQQAMRERMAKPATTDPALSHAMDEMYRDGASVGSGSTAAAVRQERATGGTVSGRMHTQKAEGYARFLERWL